MNIKSTCYQSMFVNLTLSVKSIEFYFWKLIYVAKAIKNVCKRSRIFKNIYISNSLHKLHFELHDILHVNTLLTGLTRTFSTEKLNYKVFQLSFALSLPFLSKIFLQICCVCLFIWLTGFRYLKWRFLWPFLWTKKYNYEKYFVL